VTAGGEDPLVLHPNMQLLYIAGQQPAGEEKVPDEAPWSSRGSGLRPGFCWPRTFPASSPGTLTGFEGPKLVFKAV